MRNKRVPAIWITILGLALVSVLMLAACGGGEETNTTAGATDTTAAGTETTAAHDGNHGRGNLGR